ncbi:MAG: 2OG-Fe(II) oxygenase, partial [Dongiaceae bacterium]
MKPKKIAAELEWSAIRTELDAHGCATTGVLLPPAACAALVASYEDDKRFRSRIVMARHGFGQGEYKYLATPLPVTVAAFRAEFYP